MGDDFFQQLAGRIVFEYVAIGRGANILVRDNEVAIRFKNESHRSMQTVGRSHECTKRFSLQVEPLYRVIARVSDIKRVGGLCKAWCARSELRCYDNCHGANEMRGTLV